VTELKRFSTNHPHTLRWLATALTLCVFLGLIGRFYEPGKGFSALIMFGGNMAERFIPELKALDYYVEERSYGYDAQWYAQLSMRPDIHDPELKEAIDNLSYRARRILFCWTAYLLGFGQPEWILQAYALQNVACWLGLAFLTLRWFKISDWSGFVRWLAVLFSYGLVVSVRGSLVDGPSLFLIAVGVALVEAGRVWLATFFIGLAGLGKETNILAAAALAWPRENTVKGWLGMVARGFLAVVPLLLWTAVIVFVLGPAGNTGARAFAPPFVEFWNKGVLTLTELFSDTPNPVFPLSSLYMLISLATQFLFFALRPRWRDPWWRVGAACSLLMMFLGGAVWEGYPGAASRVLLPMVLAFNVLVPKGRSWWLVLLLGNLTVIDTPSLFKPPGGNGYVLTGNAQLQKNPGTGEALKVTFDDRWFGAERTFWDYWRWSQGTAEIAITNPHPMPLTATVSFAVNSLVPRTLSFVIDGTEQWKADITRERSRAVVRNIVLKPGETRLRFVTDDRAEISGNPADDRKLSFRLYDFELKLRRIEPSGDLPAADEKQPAGPAAAPEPAVPKP
jgi:hypothetical protein